ncbi:peptidase C15 pyroglutamyl peptidase I [Gloeothece citriformis PCC 7424]|uniref:Peptidase C15 pyroglutamyl peptidase I n=1 Tax=Gloeothece citriformis (strain PCC 7424) TaxID=65393 RepID=B7K9G8_GLOC7|nr:peptidase C15 [Gloeothece citriformis]ACK68651.1 peptidase C15 pyroglutamyl peptidase I [Gloeothece citriformis PCC 7424]
MKKKLLLTSFQTWLPHHVSNSSDDLLINFHQECLSNDDIIFLRQLPVDIIRASEQAIAAIETLAPDVVICCGMAESRYQLTVESNAVNTNNKLETPVNLPSLIADLSYTTISHNAGKFVCEGLYYQVLYHLKQEQSKSLGLFLHVPLLTATNTPKILRDLRRILEQF